GWAPSVTKCSSRFSMAATAAGTATVNTESRSSRTRGDGTGWEHRTTSSIGAISPSAGATHQPHATPANRERLGYIQVLPGGRKMRVISWMAAAVALSLATPVLAQEARDHFTSPAE